MGKLVGRQQPSSCKIREIKAIMGAAKTRSLRSRSSWGGLFCQVLLGWRVDGWVLGAGNLEVPMDGWVDGWTGTGLAGWKGSLGWTIARFVEKLEPTAEAKASPTSERRRLLDAASTSEAATLTGEEEERGRGVEVLAWQRQRQWQWRGLERQTNGQDERGVRDVV